MRGPERRHGRWCCFSSIIGMHIIGVISVGFLILYMVLFVRSSQADKFNWVILLWTFVIGLPRVVFWLLIFADSIFMRKIYAMALTITTLIEVGIFIGNQVVIFRHDWKYCDRSYPVYYFVTEWHCTCTWAIFLFEMAMTTSLSFYIHACVAAFDHYHHAFINVMLKEKEVERIRDMKKKQEKLEEKEEKLEEMAKEQKAQQATLNAQQ